MATSEQMDKWLGQVLENMQLVKELVRRVYGPYPPAKNARHLVSRNKREGRYSGKKEGRHTHSVWKVIGMASGRGSTMSVARYIPLHILKRFSR